MAEENNVAAEKDMRCVTLTGFGGVRMVKVQKKPEPTTPGPGEVKIRVKVAGVNFQDLVVRQGGVDAPPKTPFTLGYECAGVIEGLGEGVEGFQLKDNVIALVEYYAWAEVVVASCAHVYKIPSGMNFQDAAALLMNYLTAYIMLFDVVGIRPGQSVLVHSAGGGVGHAVGQLCKTVKDVTLFGTCSAVKHEAMKDLVNHVFDRSTDYVQEIKKIQDDGVDVVLDCLCGEDANRGINILKPLGKYVLYGTGNVVTGETRSFFSFARSWWQVEKISPVKLYEENKSVSGFQLRSLLKDHKQKPYIKSVVDKLFQMYSKGQIKPVIDSVWAFENIGDAMQKMHEHKNIGKILLDPAMEPKVKEQKSEDTPGEAVEENAVNHAEKPEKSEKSRFMPKLSHNPLSKLKNMLSSQDQEKKEPAEAAAAAPAADTEEKAEAKEDVK